jgi:hypothetical protein
MKKAATLVMLQPPTPARELTGVDACTVAALDTITAFAVPNLGGHLATPSIFSGLAVPRVASLTDRPAYFTWATIYRSPCFSAVDYETVTLVML